MSNIILNDLDHLEANTFYISNVRVDDLSNNAYWILIRYEYFTRINGNIIWNSIILGSEENGKTDSLYTVTQENNKVYVNFNAQAKCIYRFVMFDIFGHNPSVDFKHIVI